MSISSSPFLNCTTREQLAELLGISTTKLTYYAFKSGKQYKTFSISKKSGGIRTIKAPVGGLKAIQRRLAIELASVYPHRHYVQGFVRDGSIVGNARLHLQKQQVLNIDLNDFFPTITASRIIGLLRKRPFEFNDEVASAIAGLTCYNGSLPQGAPTSPILSNMICLRMDGQLNRYAKRANATYSRYADDITFSTHKRNFSIAKIVEEFGNKEVALDNELLEIIEGNYFEINPKKTRLRMGTHSKYVTGVKVNVQPNLPRNYIRQIRSMLHAWDKFGLELAQEDFSNKYHQGKKSFQMTLQGKLAHVKNVLGDYSPVYRRLYNRFIDLEGKGRLHLAVDAIEALYEKVFVVESGNNQGTGFILDGKWFITCSHVAEDTQLHYYTWSNSAPMLHSIIDVDDSMRSHVDKFDLVALDPKRKDINNPSVSFESAPDTEEVRTGKKYKIIGFPAHNPGWKPNIMSIEVTQVQRDKYGILNAYVDKKMVGGYSGGPVLDDSNRVVGMIRRGTNNRSTGDDNIGYTFMPIEEIKRCIKEMELNAVLEHLTLRQDVIDK